MAHRTFAPVVVLSVQDDIRLLVKLRVEQA
jgi:hypothetical protein